MTGIAQEPGDSVPIVGGLVNNVLATPLPPLNREPPLNYGPPIITDIPLIDVVDSDVGSLDSDLAGAARAHTQSVRECMHMWYACEQSLDLFIHLVCVAVDSSCTW